VHFYDGFFDTPFTIFEEKSFHLLEGTMDTVLFENLQVKKYKKPLNILKNGFLYTGLRFS
jgi:hypothetical protein